MYNSKPLEEKEWHVKDFNYPAPAHAKNFGYCVGGVTVVGFMLLIITGVIMALFFTPTVDNARQSVLNLISYKIFPQVACGNCNLFNNPACKQSYFYGFLCRQT